MISWPSALRKRSFSMPSGTSSIAAAGGAVTAEMGEPKNAVVAGRLVKLCCNQCRGDLEKSPAQFVAKVDAARKGGAKEGKP
jgi:hypothetical protein